MPPAIAIDVRERPLGYPVGQGKGRKLNRTVPCMKCGKPAILLKESKRGSYSHNSYAHKFQIGLNLHNDAECTYGALCEWTDEPEAPKHDCCWPGCDQQIRMQFFLCYKHFSLVPIWLRNRIQDAYEPGKKIAAHLAAKLNEHAFRRQR